MTHQEKIDYMDVACRITGMQFHKKDLDMLISLYDLVLKKEGDTTLTDTIKVKLAVEKRAEISKKQEILNNHSTVKK